MPALMRQGVLPSKAVFKAAAACFISIVYQMNRLHSKCYKWLIKTSNRGFLNSSKKLKHQISAVFTWMVIINIYTISKGSVIFIHRYVSNGKMPKMQTSVGSKGITSMWEGQLMSGALNCKFTLQGFTRISKQLS